MVDLSSLQNYRYGDLSDIWLKAIRIKTAVLISIEMLGWNTNL